MGRDKPLISGRRPENKKVNTKSESDGYISISFRYFQNNQTEYGQNLENWHAEDMLLDMLNSFVHLTQNHITSLQSDDQKLKLYGQFPDSSVNNFPLPNSLSKFQEEKEVKWGTIRNIGGQKARIAGFLWKNIFYVVYLDKKHLFYKSKN